MDRPRAAPRTAVPDFASGPNQETGRVKGSFPEWMPMEVRSNRMSGVVKNAMVKRPAVPIVSPPEMLPAIVAVFGSPVL